MRRMGIPTDADSREHSRPTTRLRLCQVSDTTSVTCENIQRRYTPCSSHIAQCLLRVAVVALTATVLSGCAGSPTGARAGAAHSPSPKQSAIAIPGMAPCATLPQQSSSLPSTAGGDRLPALKLPCLTPGPAITLSALGGGPILINLWASWCGPCRHEAPVLQSAYEQYGQSVQFLGVDTKDATSAGAAFLSDFGVTYPQVVDYGGELLTNLGVPGLPVTVLLDRDGKIIGKHVGGLDEESMEALLSSVL